MKSPQTSSRGHPGLLRPPPHQQWPHRSHQRPPRTLTRLCPRIPQPHQLHHPLPPRNRRIQTPTTPSIMKSRFAFRTIGRPPHRWVVRLKCRSSSPAMSHVIPLPVCQDLKFDRWNCNVCGLSRKMTALNYVRLLEGRLPPSLSGPSTGRGHRGLALRCALHQQCHDSSPVQRS